MVLHISDLSEDKDLISVFGTFFLWRKLRSSSLPNSVGSRGQTQDILQDSTVAVFSDNVTIPKGILGCLKVLEDSLFLGSCSKIRLFPPFLTSPSGHQQAQKLVQSPFYTDLSSGLRKIGFWICCSPSGTISYQD